MVRQACFAVLALSCAVAGAAAHLEPPKLLPQCGGLFGLCGFIDRDTKAWVIPRRFEQVSQFGEGLASVRIKGRWGFIDETGAVVIEPRFDMADAFYQGLAEIRIGNRAGVIDRQGNIVVPPQFGRASPFTKDVLLACEPDASDRLPYGVPQCRAGLYSIRTGWLTKQIFYVYTFEHQGRGLIWATTDQDPNKGPFGLLRADGTWQVEPQYSRVIGLIGGRAIVQAPNRDGPQPAKDLQGAVDPDGRLVVPLRPWRLSFWDYGLGLVTEDGKGFDGKVGVIDMDGHIVGGRLFDKVVRAGKDGVSRVLLDGKWAGLDREGRIIADPEEGNALLECPAGVKLVWQSGGVQVIGPDSQPTVPFLLQEPGYHRWNCRQPLTMNAGAKWVYVGADGRILGDPPFFDNGYEFADGYNPVERDGKWGIIDAAGHFTVDLQYDHLRPVRRGLYEATKAGQMTLITATGVEQPAPAPEPIDRTRYLKCEPDGGTFISRSDPSGAMMWGIADPSGRELVKPVHRAIHCFRNGVALVPVDARRQWCSIDADGVVRDDVESCVAERYPYVQTHAKPEHFSDDPYENSVLWTRAFLQFGAGLRAVPPRWILDPGAVSSSIQR
jgi:hypothetical protein